MTHEEVFTANFSVHCAATATGDYFELGNHINGYSHQPLLDKWPDKNKMSTACKDYKDNAYRQQMRVSHTQCFLPHSIVDRSDSTPGPLLLSTISLLRIGPCPFCCTPSHLSAWDRGFQNYQQGSLPFSGLLGVQDQYSDISTTSSNISETIKGRRHPDIHYQYYTIQLRPSSPPQHNGQ